MSRLRRILATIGVGGGAAAATLGSASWYYARRITEPPALLPSLPPEPEDRITVVEVRGGEVVLQGPDAARPGTWGVALLRGYARVGDPTEVVPLYDLPTAQDGEDEEGAAGDGDGTTTTSEVGDGTTSQAGDEGHGDGEAEADAGAEPPPPTGFRVTRPLLLRHGTLDDGAPGLLDPYAAPPHPEVLDTPWEEVEYDSPLGKMPAWRFDVPGDTWAVFVHGRAARRHEAFRLLPQFLDAGITGLAITYRNDPDGILSPDGHSHLGLTEWQDVEAAVAYALTHGARRVVLVGYSMGGACVMAFLRRSALAGVVPAMVLEAPVLDWGAVIRQAAIERGLPTPVLPVLLPTSMGVARLRAGIDFRQLRHTGDAGAFDRPTLLIHGTEDSTVPIGLSDAVAAASPELITYLRVEGAEHVKSWNTEPALVEDAVRTFLARVL